MVKRGIAAVFICLLCGACGNFRNLFHSTLRSYAQDHFSELQRADEDRIEKFYSRLRKHYDKVLTQRKLAVSMEIAQEAMSNMLKEIKDKIARQQGKVKRVREYDEFFDYPPKSVHHPPFSLEEKDSIWTFLTPSRERLEASVREVWNRVAAAVHFTRHEENDIESSDV